MNIGVLCNSKMALPSLYHLLQMGFKLDLVLPEKSNEDREEIESFARQFGLIFQTWNKNKLNGQLNSWALSNDLSFIFVMTFPYIIKGETIKSLKIPILNFHYAPLPAFAGAQPIFWMIKNRVKQGGISVHELTEQVDSGSILHFEPIVLAENETFGSYSKRVAELGIRAMEKTITKLKAPKWRQKLVKQNLKQQKFYAKPEFKDVLIDWTKMKAAEIESLCRACNPWNKGAITSINGLMVKLIQVSISKQKTNSEEVPGTICELNNSEYLAIKTMDNQYLQIEIALFDEGFLDNKSLKVSD